MSASVTATVTESCSMSGAPFSSVSTGISGESCNIVETTLPSTSNTGSGGTPVTISGVGFDEAKLQLLYLLSDSADVDVTFTGSTSGTVTIRCAAGIARLYNIAGGIDNPVSALVGTISMTVTNNGTQGVSTDIHARMVYSA